MQERDNFNFNWWWWKEEFGLCFYDTLILSMKNPTINSLVCVSLVPSESEEGSHGIRSRAEDKDKGSNFVHVLVQGLEAHGGTLHKLLPQVLPHKLCHRKDCLRGKKKRSLVKFTYIYLYHIYTWYFIRVIKLLVFFHQRNDYERIYTICDLIDYQIQILKYSG